MGISYLNAYFGPLDEKTIKGILTICAIFGLASNNFDVVVIFINTKRHVSWHKLFVDIVYCIPK